MIHPCNPCKQGYSPAYIPNPKFIRFFNVDMPHVMYRVRQKFRQIEGRMAEIRGYSSADIRMYIDSDYCTLINFTNNRILFQYDVSESLAVMLHLLDEVCTFHYYDKYPEQIKTMSQYNHYVSLKHKYYERKD